MVKTQNEHAMILSKLVTIGSQTELIYINCSVPKYQSEQTREHPSTLYYSVSFKHEKYKIVMQHS